MRFVFGLLHVRIIWDQLWSFSGRVFPFSLSFSVSRHFHFDFNFFMDSVFFFFYLIMLFSRLSSHNLFTVHVLFSFFFLAGRVTTLHSFFFLFVQLNVCYEHITIINKHKARTSHILGTFQVWNFSTRSEYSKMVERPCTATKIKDEDGKK